MTMAEDILRTLTEGIHEDDMAESLLPGSLIIIPVDDLRKIVLKELGEAEAIKFGDLAVAGIIPAAPEALAEFFKARTDYVSSMCLAKLEEHNAH